RAESGADRADTAFLREAPRAGRPYRGRPYRDRPGGCGDPDAGRHPGRERRRDPSKSRLPWGDPAPPADRHPDLAATSPGLGPRGRDRVAVRLLDARVLHVLRVVRVPDRALHGRRASATTDLDPGGPRVRCDRLPD